jgi:hypothetical protein
MKLRIRYVKKAGIKIKNNGLLFLFRLYSFPSSADHSVGVALYYTLEWRALGDNTIRLCGWVGGVDVGK